MTRASRHVLAIDLGTSRVKVGVFDDTLATLASASASYPSLRDGARASEQRTEDWLDALARSATEALAKLEDPRNVVAVTLTAQMPTLVALSASSVVIGNAVTWQDSRADEVVLEVLDEVQRRRTAVVAGTPIDGRYLVPMHVRRAAEADYEPTTLLSAKDYLFFILTGALATDPSTASGYGVFDLERRTWSEELCDLWPVSVELLPDVVPPTFAQPLSASGSALLGGVLTGVPVFVGAADSVCAHHFVTHAWPNAISVIDGSSSVIMASCSEASTPQAKLLRTPLVDPTGVGTELDLLATGSSISWLANLVGVTASELEDLAVAQRASGDGDTMVYPYLAGGEQGALWRSDLTGTFVGVTLATTRGDLALALFEGVAFETLRCVRLLRSLGAGAPVVALTARASRCLVPALVSSLLDEPVIALSQTSPSLLGAALLAFSGLGLSVDELGEDLRTATALPAMDSAYATILSARSRRYFASSFAPVSEDGASS